MSWRDPNWKYHPASETRQPGYLERRFKEIREEQAREERERQLAERRGLRYIQASPPIRLVGTHDEGHA